MKKITKQVEEVIAFEAFDGKRFHSEEECRKYEASAANVVKKLVFDKSSDKGYSYDVFSVFAASGDDRVVVHSPETADDIRMIGQYLDLMYGDALYGVKLSTDHIGEKIIIQEGYECATIIGTRKDFETVVDNIRKTLFGDDEKSNA